MAGEERHQPLRGLRGALVSRGRASLRTRRERLLAYGPPVLQVALAVGVAWELAHLLVGSSQPVFAAITAAVSLGVTVGQRGRLAVEMVLGIAVGIGVAGVAVGVLGTGVVQLVVLAAVTMLLAVLMGGGPNLIVQSGVWAILVATFQGPGEIFPHRFLDAMVGGAVAIVFSQLVFPLDPVRTAGRAAGLVLHELADRLHRLAAALRDGDEAAAARIRHEVAALELRVSELREALAMSTGAVRLAPPRLRQRPRVERYGAAAPHIALAVQDAGSLAAAVARVIRHRDPAPALAEALDKLADGLIELAGCLAGEGSAEHCRESLVEVAAHIDTDASSTPGLLVAWSQLESMVLHLLVASGLPEEEAHRLLGSKMEADPSPDRRELLARLV